MKLGDKIYVYAFNFKLDSQKRPYSMYIPAFEECIYEKTIETIEQKIEEEKPITMINLRYNKQKVGKDKEKLTAKAKSWYKKDIKDLKKNFRIGIKTKFTDLQAQASEWKAVYNQLASLSHKE